MCAFSWCSKDVITLQKCTEWKPSLSKMRFPYYAGTTIFLFLELNVFQYSARAENVTSGI